MGDYVREGMGSGQSGDQVWETGDLAQAAREHHAQGIRWNVL